MKVEFASYRVTALCACEFGTSLTEPKSCVVVAMDVSDAIQCACNILKVTETAITKIERMNKQSEHLHISQNVLAAVGRKCRT